MKKHQILLTTSLLILTSFNLSIVSCSSDSNSKENDNIENENNNQEETTKKEETLLATFSKESCINLVNSPKTTDGIYLINDDVTDIINDITLKYSTNVGLTGNSNYPNCIQVKKQTNNNFILSSSIKKITKIIITSLKNTSYDTLYPTLELNVNSSMNEEINTTSGISEIKNTYLLNEEASTVALSNTSSRAMYLQKLEIIGYNE